MNLYNSYRIIYKPLQRFGAEHLMCGIAGVLDLQKCASPEALRQVAQRMACALRHRGPDDAGAWSDPDGGVGLGHARLSILDLSTAGHQPMLSSDERYIIAYNGEIYNYEDLKADLEDGHSAPAGGWKSHSDTEVFLECIRTWGITETLSRANGMFAFALWDRSSKVLTLGRDRIGIKPLYYAFTGKHLLFGSELKALRAHPAFQPAVNREALTLFVQHKFIPWPYSIYRNTFKLPPASILQISLTEDAAITSQTFSPFPGPRQSSSPLQPHAYWRLEDIFRHRSTQAPVCEDDAIRELEHLLHDAVAKRRIADVPLGAFLSGGIDSSLIAAIMQEQSSSPVRTFTIAFEETEYNEAPYAKVVADYLGTAHTEMLVTEKEAQDVIPLLPTIYDEPFADSSQIPTYLVSKLTRQHVTVSLSGDGGDELFGGYDRYSLTPRLWRMIGWMPPSLRQALQLMITRIPPRCINLLLGWLTTHFKAQSNTRRTVADDLLHLAETINASGRMHFFQKLVSHERFPETAVIGGRLTPTAFGDESLIKTTGSFEEAMMLAETRLSLPGQMLAKVDRASMAVGLEARVPLLDHRIVEFAYRLPLRLRIHYNESKYILRRILSQRIPAAVLDRPKMGFGVPLDRWLKGPLRDWCETLLDERRLRHDGFFDPRHIRQRWHDFINGRRAWHYELWDILVFQAWLETT